MTTGFALRPLFIGWQNICIFSFLILNDGGYFEIIRYVLDSALNPRSKWLQNGRQHQLQIQSICGLSKLCLNCVIGKSETFSMRPDFAIDHFTVAGLVP